MPTYKHDSEQSARTEAERLARTHGGSFHVMALTATCTKNDVTWDEPQFAPRRGRAPRRSAMELLPVTDPSHPAYQRPDDRYDDSDPFADE